MHSYAPYDSTSEGCIALHPYDSTSEGCVALHPYDSTAVGCVAVHPACQSAAAWHTSGRGGGRGIRIAGRGRDGFPADDASGWPW